MSAPPAIGAPSPVDPRQRPALTLVLLLVLALFFGPLIAAFVLYYGMHWRPAGQTNHGTLIEPRAAAAAGGPAALLRGKWSLVYIGAGSCDQDCRSTLYFIRETYLGLGQLMPRAQQFPGDIGLLRRCLARARRPAVDYPQSRPSGQCRSRALLRLFPQDQRATTVFVVDPEGNLMMRYDAHSAPRGLHDDLQKLLALSDIGQRPVMFTSHAAPLRVLTLISCSVCLIVVVLGAYVRLNDAGLGCPDWPGVLRPFESTRRRRRFRQPRCRRRDRTAERAAAGAGQGLAGDAAPLRRRHAGTADPVLASCCCRMAPERLVPLGLALAIPLLVIVQALFGMLTVTWRLKPSS